MVIGRTISRVLTDLRPGMLDLGLWLVSSYYLPSLSKYILYDLVYRSSWKYGSVAYARAFHPIPADLVIKW